MKLSQSLVLALLVAAPALAGGDPELGQRIYREGVLPSGGAIGGTAVDDLALGTQGSCATCHRRSGYGSFEGGVYVPPVTGRFLFEDREERRVDHFRRLFQDLQSRELYAEARVPRERPPYDAASLAVALREGRDPSGRELHPLMPRYELSDSDLEHLRAYLETLGAEPDPGVDSETISFATVVTPGADADELRAMREVTGAYVEWKNKDTEGLLARPGHSPWHRDDFAPSYRRWEHREWPLAGPPETWGEQLEEFYRERPVFALLSGLGEGSWAPIGSFCERHELPCLFPHTDLPALEGTGETALYFSRGLSLEAEVLAEHLRGEDGSFPQIHQIFEGERAMAAANTLTGTLGQGVGREAGVWILWSEEPELSGVPETAERIFLSSTLLGEHLEDGLAELGPGLRERIRIVHPYALPGREPPRIYRVRGWLRSRGLGRDHERLRLGTYFAFSIADHALHHVVDHYSRDYFLEAVQHLAENALDPGLYPRLSLGPGQRFASKGAYVLELTAEGELAPVTGWIVPSGAGLSTSCPSFEEK